MEYLRFIISDYRAIKGPLTVDLSKFNVMPIIGVNECGKTTILQAILCFDSFNDDILEGRHLQDIENLYTPNPPAPSVSAIVKLTWSELVDVVETVCKKRGSRTGIKSFKNKESKFEGIIEIQRNLRSRKYKLITSDFAFPGLENEFNDEIVRRLPFTIYFDDFRDSIRESIEIPDDPEEGSSWYDIIDVLFEKSGCGISLGDLPSSEERRRKAALSKVNAHLKKILTREWQSFRLDDVDALKVAVDFETVPQKVLPIGPGSSLPPTINKNFLKFEVVETSDSGEEHYFYIRDRSKGFYWFFNFVMKLQFNPTEAGHSLSQKAIFLLDEPGCYLHATAQKKLCKKFIEIAEDNVVIFCTHSQYLLDPKYVPIQAVRIADRNDGGDVELKPISSYKADTHVNRTAFQPVIDALELTPFSMELCGNNVVVVEGVTDFYAMASFFDGEFVFLPSVGADSLKYSIPFLLASATRFCALWDNDEKGVAARDNALEEFGTELEDHFILLPKIGNKKTVLEDLFSKNDLVRLCLELDLPPNTKAKKIFPVLYYSNKRRELISKCDSYTIQNFDCVRKILLSRFST